MGNGYRFDKFTRERRVRPESTPQLILALRNVLWGGSMLKLQHLTCTSHLLILTRTKSELKMSRERLGMVSISKSLEVNKGATEH